MGSWPQALREGMLAGSIASILSAVVLLAAGQRRENEPAAPVNAISHWFWGDPALREDRPTVRHTLTGYLIHHLASVFWATLHARVWGMRTQAKQPLPAMAGAAAAASVACFVDYRLTPQRLTPGFEHRLPRRTLAGVYASFAVGLALGSILAAAAWKPRDNPLPARVSRDKRHN